MEGLGLLSPRLLDPGPIETPCFIIDKGALRANLAVLAKVQARANCTILLALKGFAAWSVADLVGGMLSGVAASSPHEARLGREEFGGQVHTYSPAFVPKSFHEVMEFSDHIIFNSFGEWQRHKEKVTSFHRPIQCGLRINPEHSEVQTALYDPCGPASRLGITQADFRPDLLEGISGLHFHNLCELGADALERTLEAVETRFGEFLSRMRWMNFGGGHHITKPGYDIEKLVALVTSFQTRHNLRVILEPGEAIALGAGVLVARVLDLTQNGDKKLAILDTSATAHMPDVLEMPYRPELVGAKPPGATKHCYQLGGLSCLAGDVIGDYCFETELQVGQQLIFLDMAHYSMVKTSHFNGVQHPSIATYEPRSDELVTVRRFGYESYRNRLS